MRTSHSYKDQTACQIIFAKTLDSISVRQVYLDHWWVTLLRVDVAKGCPGTTVIWTWCCSIAWPRSNRPIGCQVEPILHKVSNGNSKEDYDLWTFCCHMLSRSRQHSTTKGVLTLADVALARASEANLKLPCRFQPWPISFHPTALKIEVVARRNLQGQVFGKLVRYSFDTLSLYSVFLSLVLPPQHHFG